MTNKEKIEYLKTHISDGGVKSTPITQEILDEMKSRNSSTYSSGRERKVGDWFFIGMLRDDSTAQIITLCEDEYGTIYTDDPLYDEKYASGGGLLNLIKKN